jgi:CO dehydrogenase/acetyl-CoA synthase beta subunit
MIRTHPSRQSLWFRIDQASFHKRLTLAHWGSALIEKLKEVEFVTGVELFFITTDKVNAEPIKDMAFEAGRIVGALMKMGDEMDFDCDSCEFWDVCKNVEELKRIRKRMQQGSAQ